jgi:hypothetical protein
MAELGHKRSDPPSYMDTAITPTHLYLPDSEPLSLVIDGTSIFLSQPPSTALYELTSPLDVSAPVVGLHQVSYKVAESWDGPKVKSYDKDLYELSISRNRSNYLFIEAKRPSCAAGVRLHRSLRLSGHYWEMTVQDKEEKTLTSRNYKDIIIWESVSGRLVAEETRAGKSIAGYDTGKEERILPRLDVKDVLDQDQLNLLVAAWCGRVWHEATHDTKEKKSIKEKLHG